METYVTGTGQRVRVHEKKDCKGEHCVIHNPSDHPMRSFRTHWRDDRKLMERICPHGIGHPDPDDIAFKRRVRGDKFADLEMIHGCCGECCRGAYGVETELTDDLSAIPKTAVMDSNDPRVERFLERSRISGTPEWAFRVAVREVSRDKPPPVGTTEEELVRASIMVLMAAEPEFFKEFPSLKGDA